MVDHESDINRQSEPIKLSDDSRRAKSRLFFGGSFDPPHIGHTELPMSIAGQLDGAHVIFVPAARSPFKDDAPAKDHHRIEMIKIAMGGYRGWEIWEQELHDATMNPNQPSYWADTWAIVCSMGLAGTNRFLIGTDQALSMHRWCRYEHIWKDALVVLRDQTNSIDALSEQLGALGVWNDTEIEHWRLQTITADTIDASSTAIREALRDPSSREDAIDGLNLGVHRYILEHDLYR